MNRRKALVLLLAAAAMPGCVSASHRGQIGGALDEAEYTLASGDRIRLIVFGQDSLSNIYAVDGSGRITMPLISSVEVAGLTTREVAERVAARLRAGYIREPRVTVEIDTYRPFYILGEVARAGQFPYAAGMTVQTAVAIAGGYTPRASQRSAAVTRLTENGLETFTVSVHEPVRPGDTLVIRERWF
jgi:polysaccharide biosynthesis/export protein